MAGSSGGGGAVGVTNDRSGISVATGEPESESDGPTLEASPDGSGDEVPIAKDGEAGGETTAVGGGDKDGVDSGLAWQEAMR